MKICAIFIMVDGYVFFTHGMWLRHERNYFLLPAWARREV